MNKDDIKKALECCVNPSINPCKDCPYNKNGDFSYCNDKILKDTLNLITEQEKEIERLKAENACLLKACEEQFTFDTTQNKKYSIFNSVRKEFAEKVKAKYYVNDYCREVVEIEKIDELLKEYE